MSEIIDKILLKEKETLTYQRKWQEEHGKDRCPSETPSDNGLSVRLPYQCVQVGLAFLFRVAWPADHSSSTNGDRPEREDPSHLSRPKRLLSGLLFPL